MIPTLDNPMFYELKEQADIQSILRQIDPLVLMQKITNFRKLNISHMNNAEIDQARSDLHCSLCRPMETRRTF